MVRAFSGVFLVFLGVFRVFLGCSGFSWGCSGLSWECYGVFGGVPGFSVVPECSVMFRCSGVPGSTTCPKLPRKRKAQVRHEVGEQDTHCHVLTRLNEPHQRNMVVHSKHVLLKICARIYTHASNLHISIFGKCHREPITPTTFLKLPKTITDESTLIR